MPMRPSPRRFANHFLLRFHMLLILCGMLGGSLLLNKALLWMHVDAMMVRSPLNVLAAYVFFFVFIRLWLAYIRSQCEAQIGHLDFDEAAWVNREDRKVKLKVYPSGKSSDGKRGGPSWGDLLDPLGNSITEIGEGCAVIMLIVALVACLLGLFFGGLFIIVDAPLILSEIAGSFLLAGMLTRPAYQMDRPHWTGSVFRQTWKWFLGSLVVAFILGFLAQHACPEAETMLDVIRWLPGRG